jgi:hypothetical protein
MATITVPKTYESSAWCSAARRTRQAPQDPSCIAAVRVASRHGPVWLQPLVDVSIQRRGDEMKRAMKGLIALMFLRQRGRRSRHAHR